MSQEKIAKLFQTIADNLNNGNSNLDQEQLDLITDTICASTTPLLSTYEAIKYLNVSRNYFYDHIKPKLKGKKIAGQKTIMYCIKDLNNIKLSLS